MLKCLNMKLGKILFTQSFFLFIFFVLITGLISIGVLYYVLNTQYQKPKNPFINGPITKVPKTLRLDLDQPDQDLLSFSPSIVVSGKTNPLKEVLISTEEDDLVIKSKRDGSFSTVLNLSEGINTITVASFDLNGETKSLERTVFYSKEKI